MTLTVIDQVAAERRRRDLGRDAALIVAEIERHGRAATGEQK